MQQSLFSTVIAVLFQLKMIELIKKIFTKYREQISYLFFGALTTLVSFVSYNLLYYVVFAKSLNVTANVISEFLAITFAYVTNKIFVFESRTPNFSSFIREILLFYALRVGASVLNVGGMYVLVDLLSFEGWICKIVMSIIVIILNYVFSKVIIFKKKKVEGENAGQNNGIEFHSESEN